MSAYRLAGCLAVWLASQSVRTEILTQLWPQLEGHLLPVLYETTAPAGPCPLDGWPKPLAGGDPSLPSLRISDMFVRRYSRPPKGSPERRDR